MIYRQSEQVMAMKKLLWFYENPKKHPLPSFRCPLCKVVSNSCRLCVWASETGIEGMWIEELHEYEYCPCVKWLHNNMPYVTTWLALKCMHANDFGIIRVWVIQERIAMLRRWIFKYDVNVSTSNRKRRR